MNWYNILKFSQQSNITIDLSDYISSLDKYIQESIDAQEERQYQIGQFQFDKNKFQTLLNNIPNEVFDINTKNQITTSIESGDKNKIDEILDFLLKFRVDNSKKLITNNQYMNIRDLFHYLDYYNDKLSDNKNGINKEEWDRFKKEQIEKTNNNMKIIEKAIQEAIERNPTISQNIIIKAYSLLKENLINGIYDETSAMVEFGQGDLIPNFTVFQHEGKFEIEDVLEGGDTDFFKDNKTQADYFNLINEIRHPGSTSKGKILTLYTARPSKDRQLYLNKNSVPVNIFLTNMFDSAEGIARDFGNRDVWKIRIDSRYLVNTMDSPMEKQYQTTGSSEEVPVILTELLIMDEKE